MYVVVKNIYDKIYWPHICTILTSTNLDNIYIIIHICDPNVYNYSTNVCI